MEIGETDRFDSRRGGRLEAICAPSGWARRLRRAGLRTAAVTLTSCHASERRLRRSRACLAATASMEFSRSRRWRADSHSTGGAHHTAISRPASSMCGGGAFPLDYQHRNEGGSVPECPGRSSAFLTSRQRRPGSKNCLREVMARALREMWPSPSATREG